MNPPEHIAPPPRRRLLGLEAGAATLAAAGPLAGCAASEPSI